MSIEFKLAKTEAEKEAIFRFRYQIYIEEMNRPAHANHEKRMIYDWMDPHGNLLYATLDDKIVASARINLKKEGPIEFESEYQINAFGDSYPDNIATTTKLMIEPTKRRSTLAARFTCYLFQFGKDNDIDFDFININEPLLDFYHRLGYQRYTQNFDHPEFGEVIPLVLCMSDIGFLKEVRSPFYKIASIYTDKSKETHEIMNYFRNKNG